MRMIKFRAKRVNGGEWVKSMTISYGTGQHEYRKPANQCPIMSFKR